MYKYAGRELDVRIAEKITLSLKEAVALTGIGEKKTYTNVKNTRLQLCHLCWFKKDVQKKATSGVSRIKLFCVKNIHS